MVNSKPLEVLLFTINLFARKAQKTIMSKLDHALS